MNEELIGNGVIVLQVRNHKIVQTEVIRADTDFGEKLCDLLDYKF